MTARDIRVASQQAFKAFGGVGRRYQLVWAMVLLAPALLMGQAAVDEAETGDASPSAVDGVGGATDESAATSDEDKEQQKRRYQLYLVFSGVLIAFLFITFLLISVVRLSRFIRQRYKVGEKSTATEYVDAWSKYRLEEEGDAAAPEESSSL